METALYDQYVFLDAYSGFLLDYWRNGWSNGLRKLQKGE